MDTEVNLIKKLFCGHLVESFNISFISIIKINGRFIGEMRRNWISYGNCAPQ